MEPLDFVQANVPSFLTTHYGFGVTHCSRIYVLTQATPISWHIRVIRPNISLVA